nr:hypothetical protein [Sphingomonas populi]
MATSKHPDTVATAKAAGSYTVIIPVAGIAVGVIHFLSPRLARLDAL